ncbi:MAG TPA: hypothetical protein V6D29_05570 [Leptolyngbyaceae cyanobacterium]
MMTLIAGVFARVSSVLKTLQVKQFLSVVLVGFILLSTSVGSEPVSKNTVKKIDKIVHQDDSNRPKTTREWKNEARQVKGDPGERAKRIGEESADAVKDWAELYPQVAKDTVPGIGDK